MAERAVALDPDDLEASFLRARALVRLGRTTEAVWILRAVAARRPYLVAPWLELEAIAASTPDPKERLSLSGEAGGNGPPDSAQTPPSPSPTRTARGATRPSPRAISPMHSDWRSRRMSGWERLTLRAVLLGRAPMARELAAIVLTADPTDGAARIGVAAAADLEGDVAGLARAMRAIPTEVVSLSPLARLLFAEVLARRVGADAAMAWKAAAGVADAVAETTDSAHSGGGPTAGRKGASVVSQCGSALADESWTRATAFFCESTHASRR